MPVFALIGAYLHGDEQGGVHVHLDYIPVAHGYRRGPDTQTGLSRALQEQGIEPGESYKETAQIAWERRENAELERICAEHGLVVDHPQQRKREKAQHIDTDLYRTQQELQKVEHERDVLMWGQAQDKALYEQWKVRDLQAHQQRKEEELQEAREELQKARQEIDTLKEKYNALADEYNALVDDYDTLEAGNINFAREVVARAERVEREEPVRSRI